MSGGVDSSVAAALLLEQGYDVAGIMLRLWFEPARPVLGGEVEAANNRCCSDESVNDARAVADRLGIPFYVIDARARFKQQVVDGWIASYAAGLTPNPCLSCNKHIRFGFLLDYARSLGAAYLATGHYARIRRGDDGRLQLWRGVDRAKDQSYVLSVLGQTKLQAVLFPVGEYTKTQVRAIAAERGLPTASRGTARICVSSPTAIIGVFWPRSPGMRYGPVRSSMPGAVCWASIAGCPSTPWASAAGWAWQRRSRCSCFRWTSSAMRWWSVRAMSWGRPRFRQGRCIGWEAAHRPGSFEAAVQIRYHAQPAAASITVDRETDGARVQVAAPLRDVTPGQAAVFYQGENCLGSGLIARG